MDDFSNSFVQISLLFPFIDINERNANTKETKHLNISRQIEPNRLDAFCHIYCERPSEESFDSLEWIT